MKMEGWRGLSSSRRITHRRGGKLSLSLSSPVPLGVEFGEGGVGLSVSAQPGTESEPLGTTTPTQIAGSGNSRP